MKHNRDIRDNKRALWRLKSRCEKAKKLLSSSCYASIEIDCLHKDFDFSATLSRAKFEELTIDLLKRFVEPVTRCLNDADMKKCEIDDVVLVGGSTRIPKLRQLVAEVMGGKEFVNNGRVHPDEAVAYGAAVHAAILSGVKNAKIRDIVLKDVAPLSLGTDVVGDLMCFIIPRNTPIPAARECTFFTMHDNQLSMGVKVYEGERAKASDNNLLGEFALHGIPPEPRGVGKVAVCFKVDANGILNVSATEVTTRKGKGVIIVRENGGLSKKKIEGMIADAERYKEKDKKYRLAMEAKNSLD